MSAAFTFIAQQAGPAAPAAPPAPTAGQVDAAQIRDQIRQSINDATEATRQAAQDAREHASHMRDAAQRVREAEAQLRNATTADQKGAARQELDAAQGELRALQGSAPVFGHTSQPAMPMGNMIPPQAVDIALGFFFMCAVMVIGWPLSRAFGRRLERRGESQAAIPASVTEQLQRIEQAVDAMSVEIERISESQRFLTKLQNQAGVERMALPRDRV
jgi:hypothetical protein